MIGRAEQDPSDVILYALDWTSFLDGDTLATSAWTVPSELTSSGATLSTTATQIKISGGQSGKEYAVTNRITTSVRGETAEETINVRIMEH
jgi:hypothetical protein